MTQTKRALSSMTFSLFFLTFFFTFSLNGQNIAIGDITPTEKLHVDGNLKINGLADIGASALVMVNSEGVLSAISKPIVIRTYQVNNSTLTLPFNYADYSAAVVGMRAIGGDINENGVLNPIQVYTYKNGDKWAVFADFATHGLNETWTVDVMFVRRELTDDNR